jgi:3-hydroxybutyryl-CoA dehydrogenase
MAVSVIGVVGAGFMGSGIAQSAAAAGKYVLLYEPDEAPLDRSRREMQTRIQRAVAHGHTGEQEGHDLLDRIVYTRRFEDLEGADAVVEAVTEDARVKRPLFGRLDEEFPDALFLASNTSSIPIAELAASTRRPDRVLGLHFFSPVPVMKLVEVVVGLDTSATVLTVAEDFAREIGKEPIRTKDRSGFIVNMLLVPYLMAGVRMYEEGFATKEDIDRGMKLGCGHPMGPLTLCDFIGLDVLYAVCNSLYEEFKRAEYAPPPLMKRMVATGRLGRKTNRGFYDYVTEPVAAGVPS